MKDIWLAQWFGDSHPQIASSTFEGLLKAIDEWYNYPEDEKVIKTKFKRNSEEFDEYRFGSVEYTSFYNEVEESDIVYILNYYYD